MNPVIALTVATVIVCLILRRRRTPNEQTDRR